MQYTSVLVLAFATFSMALPAVLPAVPVNTPAKVDYIPPYFTPRETGTFDYKINPNFP